jgi:hypothetical protein
MEKHLTNKNRPFVIRSRDTLFETKHYGVSVLPFKATLGEVRMHRLQHSR